MIQDTLNQIERRVAEAEAIKPEARQELADLVAKLRQEVAQLAETHGDDARSITGFAHISAHEATRDTRNPRLLQIALDGLNRSVAGFEQSHPKLVQVVNRICETLSGLGV
ncbi:MAG TPA: DUF4404 family protein [Methylomirabilota bacterium]|nr:DUF4404 family protein [Methylomirabilota bacterium]